MQASKIYVQFIGAVDQVCIDFYPMSLDLDTLMQLYSGYTKYSPTDEYFPYKETRTVTASCGYDIQRALEKTVLHAPKMEVLKIEANSFLLPEEIKFSHFEERREDPQSYLIEVCILGSKVKLADPNTFFWRLFGRICHITCTTTQYIVSSNDYSIEYDRDSGKITLYENRLVPTGILMPI